jgi:quercetin dioxygenase-like cupin family protein
MTDDIQFLASRARVHVSAAQTDDAFTLIEMVAPAGDQTPLHVHRDSDEAFYVLEGEITLWVGEETYVLGPGDSAFAPRGVPHTLRHGDPGARSLVASTPASFEAFVRAVGAAGMPSPDELGRIAAEHGIEILGPPGMLPSELTPVAAS